MLQFLSKNIIAARRILHSIGRGRIRSPVSENVYSGPRPVLDYRVEIEMSCFSICFNFDEHTVCLPRSTYTIHTVYAEGFSIADFRTSFRGIMMSWTDLDEGE